jgi:hypothetical protein
MMNVTIYFMNKQRLYKYNLPFIHTLGITCLTLIVFVIVFMNEIVSLVPRALYLIDWTAVSGAYNLFDFQIF